MCSVFMESQRLIIGNYLRPRTVPKSLLKESFRGPRILGRYSSPSGDGKSGSAVHITMNVRKTWRGVRSEDLI